MKAISLLSPAFAFSSNSNIIVAQKSKKPKSSSSPAKSSEVAPPRITSNVKQNLQFLKSWKEFQKRKSGAHVPATSYRKKKVEKDDIPDDTDLYRDPTLTLYYTNQGIITAVPVLLVDGYNVCGYWAKLKKHFINGNLDIARQKLIDELITFSMLREVKVVVVFDAMLSGLPTHKEEFVGIDVVFSSETCADAWIEKEVVALRDDGCPRVWVVTSDRCQQQAAHGACVYEAVKDNVEWGPWTMTLWSDGCCRVERMTYFQLRNPLCETVVSLYKGAFVWTCKALISEIKASQKEVETMLQEQRSSSMQGKLLKHNLDSQVVNALKDLRKKLSENGL